MLELKGVQIAEMLSECNTDHFPLLNSMNTIIEGFDSMWYKQVLLYQLLKIRRMCIVYMNTKAKMESVYIDMTQFVSCNTVDTIGNQHFVVRRH